MASRVRQQYPFIFRKETGVPKTRGQSGSELLVFACLVAGLQSWIPLLELLSERAVEGARPGLQHEMRPGFDHRIC